MQTKKFFQLLVCVSERLSELAGGPDCEILLQHNETEDAVSRTLMFLSIHFEKAIRFYYLFEKNSAF